MGERDFQDLIL